MRRKYELVTRFNSTNFRREDVIKSVESARKEVELKAFDLKRHVIPIKEEPNMVDQPKGNCVSKNIDKLPTY